MDGLSRVREWIEAGKQVGKSASIVEAGSTYWVAVGIQKWQGEYKLYLFKAEESRMSDLDYYDVEGIIRVAHFEDVVKLLYTLCPFGLAELTPQKGSKIFNPAFE